MTSGRDVVDHLLIGGSRRRISAPALNIYILEVAALKDSVPQACINAPLRRLSNLNLLHTSSKYSAFIVSFYTSSTSFVDMSASDLAGGS